MSVRDRRQTPRSRLVCGSRSSRPSWGRHLRPNASLSLPVSDGKVRSYAHSFRTEYPVERQKRVDLTRSPSPCGMAAICAKQTAGVDVIQTLGIAAVDVAAGGKTSVHLGAMASPRRRTARFAHASNALHPTLV